MHRDLMPFHLLATEEACIGCIRHAVGINAQGLDVVVFLVAHVAMLRLTHLKTSHLESIIPGLSRADTRLK